MSDPIESAFSPPDSGNSSVAALLAKLRAGESLAGGEAHALLTVQIMRPAFLEELSTSLSPSDYGRVLETIWTSGAEAWREHGLVRIAAPLAILYSARGDWERAGELWGRLDAYQRERWGQPPASCLNGHDLLGSLRRSVVTHARLFCGAKGDEQGPWTGASRLAAVARAVELVEAAAGEGALSVALLLDSLAHHRVSGEPDTAIREARRALAIREQVLGPDALLTCESRRSLGTILARTGARDEAEDLLLGVLEERADDLESSIWLIALSVDAALSESPSSRASTFDAWWVGDPKRFRAAMIHVPRRRRVLLTAYLWRRITRADPDPWPLALELRLAFLYARADRVEAERRVWNVLGRMQASWGDPADHRQADARIIRMHRILQDEVGSLWDEPPHDGIRSPLESVRRLVEPLRPVGTLAQRFLAQIAEVPVDPAAPAVPLVRGALPGIRDLCLRESEGTARILYRLMCTLAVTELRAGGDHPCTASCLNRLAVYALNLGAPETALSLSRQSLEIREAWFGPRHSLVALNLFNLGAALLSLRRPEEAETCLDRSIRIAPRRSTGHYWLARLYRDRCAPGDPERERGALQRYLDLAGDSPDQPDRVAEGRRRLKEIANE